jgi:hypothetical protein
MSFAEIGSRFSGLEGVDDWTGLSLADTIVRMVSCEYFVGIISGPMHMAAALDLKIIAVINFPPPELLCFPVLKDIMLVESEWSSSPTESVTCCWRCQRYGHYARFFPVG